MNEENRPGEQTLETFRNHRGNLEILDEDLRNLVSGLIAEGRCDFVPHEPEGDEGVGWDEFTLKLPDGRVLRGSYGWEEEGYRTLWIER